jgi:hypothetical protein
VGIPILQRYEKLLRMENEGVKTGGKDALFKMRGDK